MHVVEMHTYVPYKRNAPASECTHLHMESCVSLYIYIYVDVDVDVDIHTDIYIYILEDVEPWKGPSS